MSNAIYKKDLHDVALAVAQGSKDYTDKTKEEIYWHIGDYSISTQADNTTASTKTVPSGATRVKIKKIYGLTEKFNPSVAYDDASTMTKTMPNVVYDFDCSVVYGNSEVSENTFVIPNIAETTTSGITWKVQNGTFYFNGTANASFSLNLLQYCTLTTNVNIKFFDIQGTSTKSSITQINSTYSAPTTSGTSIENLTTFRFFADSGQSFTNYSFKIMVVSGTTPATSWSLGFEGIHNLELSGLKVEGENKVNVNDKTETTTNGITYSSNGGVIKLRGTATAGFNISWTSKVSLPKGSYKMALFYSGSYTGVIGNYLKTTGGVIVLDGNTLTNPTTTLNLTEDKTNIYFDMYIGSNAVISQEITIMPMLVLGTTMPTTFVPYIAPTTKTIDLSTILYNGNPLFEGNSLKAVGTAKDYITPYKAHKEVNQYTVNVNASIFSWGGYWYLETTNFNDNKKSSAILTSLEDSIYFNSVFESNGNLKTTLDTTNYTSASQVKQVLLGKTIQYQVNTPIEVSIDWSSTLRGIQGYSNGTITLQNTYNMDTANTITYNSIIKENCCAKIVQSRGGSVVKTINFPTQASDGYSAGSVNNVRDFTTSKRYTNVNKGDLGSYNYTYDASTTIRFYTDATPLNVKLVSSSQITNMLNALYSATSSDDFFSSSLPNMTMIVSTNNVLSIRNANYTDTTTFKTAMANEPLYYELADASKTESDITAIENIIEVQPNDVLSFYDSNDNLVTVPSDLTYRIEVERV